jgi:hypothetical protein
MNRLLKKPVALMLWIENWVWCIKMSKRILCYPYVFAEPDFPHHLLLSDKVNNIHQFFLEMEYQDLATAWPSVHCFKYVWSKKNHTTLFLLTNIHTKFDNKEISMFQVKNTQASRTLWRKTNHMQLLFFYLRPIEI